MLRYKINHFTAVIVSLVCGLCLNVSAQTPGSDTLNKGKPITQFDEIYNGVYSDTLTTHIWVFGNPECPRCEEFKALLKAAAVPFIDYDMRDYELAMQIHNLIVKQAHTQRISYGFPVVIVNTKIYYSIPDLMKFTVELKEKFK
jgi:hypothetical protein